MIFLSVMSTQAAAAGHDRHAAYNKGRLFLVSIVGFVGISLLTDVAYAVLDPRIRYARGVSRDS